LPASALEASYSVSTRMLKGIRLPLALLVAAFVAACKRPAPKPEPSPVASAAPTAALDADRFSRAGLVREAWRFVHDAAFRRTELDHTFTNPSNTYSAERLSHYGFRTRGWDLLPEWNPRSAVIASADTKPADKPLWDGKEPTTWEEWTLLGREVFFRYPLRSEVFVKFALENPEAARKYGVHRASDGTYPGLVSFVDEDGHVQRGITCALCHASVDAKGEQLVGEARRDFDFGALRLAVAAKTGATIEPVLAGRFRQWGPGRADVTEDDDEDPVAIPDLWGLKHQKFLTQAGTIRHEGPAALMLRQETQLLTSNHQKIRPPRTLAAALSLYVYSLEAPKSTAPESPRGKALFSAHCQRCHSNPAGGGDLVSHAIVETNSALALGKARGTGYYRPPALIRASHAAPYLHYGAVRTLADLLDPARLRPGFERGQLGKGAILGHPYGTELPKEDRDALVAHLMTL
jgi:hypothetical protein